MSSIARTDGVDPHDNGRGVEARVSPFVERLRVHTANVGGRDSSEQRDRSAAPAGTRLNQLAFWNSPVARAAINRRVTGDPHLAPEVYFARRYGPDLTAATVLSMRATNAKLEVAILECGPCARVLGFHDDPGRVHYANSKVPETLRPRVAFELGDFADWPPVEPLGGVMARSALHRYADLEGVLNRIDTALVPGGLIFVDEYVGPARSQWGDQQLEIINRLLAVLPDELLVELTGSEGRHKRSVGRPPLESWSAANPDEMVRSDEILPGLDARFERVEVALYGGAIFHQLFSRIMGNFATRPELVGALMEFDALLTDLEVVSSDYVWGVWRKT